MRLRRPPKRGKLRALIRSAMCSAGAALRLSIATVGESLVVPSLVTPVKNGRDEAPSPNLPRRSGRARHFGTVCNAKR